MTFLFDPGTPILNSGLLGGRYEDVLDVLNTMVEIYAELPGLNDFNTCHMPVFNEAVRLVVARKGLILKHGSPFNSVYKGFETSGSFIYHKRLSRSEK